MIERGIPRTDIEYAEICKTVRKLLRDDIREYNNMRVKEAVETGKAIKKANNKEKCKVMIPSLKEEDGSITTNRERILERDVQSSIKSCMRTQCGTSQNWRQRKYHQYSPVKYREPWTKSRAAKHQDKTRLVEMIKTVEIALRKIQKLFKAILRTETMPKEWKMPSSHWY